LSRCDGRLKLIELSDTDPHGYDLQVSVCPGLIVDNDIRIIPDGSKHTSAGAEFQVGATRSCFGRRTSKAKGLE